jgi:hypothetical protein
MAEQIDAERRRLEAIRAGTENWRGWGPFVSERQWGTVREDYSANGDAWNYLPHDEARSRAYRWGEDGIAGFCDDRQLLCLSLALWNGRDSILKERLFGLNNGQGNHGEDVKEHYYYLDAVPSHAYGKMLYKYPQAAYPYQRLIDENARNGLNAREFELLDTGIFDEDRYFDVEVEYAKASPSDILMRVVVSNRGPDTASIHILPQASFRNIWSWSEEAAKPHMSEVRPGEVIGDHETLGGFALIFEAPDRLAFCDNDTNAFKLFGAQREANEYFKDGVNDFIVAGDESAINPDSRGTKAAGVYRREIPAGGAATVRVRLTLGAGRAGDFQDFDNMLEQRRKEADAFYAVVQAKVVDADLRRIQRQALAGMLWSKQFYHFDVEEWLTGDPRQPPPPKERLTGRNSGWRHLNAADIISVPDKWEYPWFAAWDLAYHSVAYSLVDPDLAKRQLLVLCRSWMMRPSGELPAYEWAFGDVNPPVQAWAALRVYENDRRWSGGAADTNFLERIFQKLMLNFTWWVNRKDAKGLNVFEGGFLGLDNIGVFNRSAPLPTGGHLQQSDGTAWMAMYCLNMLQIAIELGQYDVVYEDMATMYFEHFLLIARAMNGREGGVFGLWDETDDFYYDRLCMPDGSSFPMRIRSMVGLLALIAVAVIDGAALRRLPGVLRRMSYYRDSRSDLASLVSRWEDPGAEGAHLLAIARRYRMGKILGRMLDENEFLSPYGVRAVSRYHSERPYEFEYAGANYGVKYLPAESDSRLFGGNSNWRGPIWAPMNYLLIDSLRRFHRYYGDDVKIECPTGSGIALTLAEIADDLSRRMIALFARRSDGRRPVFGDYGKLQSDPHFRDYILFHEYFDGDNGRGLGASHQTGWTGLVANLIDELAAPRKGS